MVPTRVCALMGEGGGRGARARAGRRPGRDGDVGRGSDAAFSGLLEGIKKSYAQNENLWSEWRWECLRLSAANVSGNVLIMRLMRSWWGPRQRAVGVFVRHSDLLRGPQTYFCRQNEVIPEGGPGGVFVRQSE